MSSLSTYEGVSSDDIDPCTGFPTTHKAKLSIPQILWTRTTSSGGGGDGSGQNSFSSESFPPPLSPIDSEIQNRVSTLQRDEKRNNENEKGKRQGNHWIGLVFTLLSALTFSFSALSAKLLSDLDPFNLGVWTSLGMTVISGIWIIYQVKIKKDDENEICTEDLISSLKETGSGNRKLYVYFLYLRAFCGASGLILFFYSVKYLSVADALVIDASSPIFVYLMAYLFLSEKLGLLSLLTTLLAFSGVALIARPPILLNAASTHASTETYDLTSLIGATLSFFSMLCIATTIIALKFLETVHHSIINFTFGLWGTLECLLIAGFNNSLSIPSELDEILKIFGISILFFLGQAFITLALQYQDAGPVGLVRTTEVVFIFVWQLIFLGVVPDVYSWFGALLILVGVVLTLLRNWISELTPESKLRNNCKLLLY